MSPATSHPLLIDLLMAEKKLTEKNLETILREQEKHSLGLEEAIVQLGLAKEDDIARIYAHYFQLELFQGPMPKVGPDLKTFLPEKFARDNHVLPLVEPGQPFRVLLLDPSDISLLQEVQLYTGQKAQPMVGILSKINEGLDAIYGARDAVKEITTEIQPDKMEIVEEDEELLDLNRVIPESKETQIVRLVNRILEGALRERASDIHTEPFPDEIKIRYRIDGVLQEITPPPKSLYVALISRLKVLCKMDIAEKRIPQDGSFTMAIDDKRIDCRVSTVPTVYGERMVLRILNKDAVPMDLTSLGFEKRQLEDFVAGASSPHGLQLVTGPTGSGKSTTLYATLSLLRSPKKNILTIEDPVEYKFNGINQVQVKSQVGLTFASALRAFLRQDPDIIMVGEVRDQETAEICLRAALTGHLVLSTLHTNDAVTAITRLQNMGIERFLLASTLRVVEAQRLVRRLCPHCKTATKPSVEMVDKYGLDPKVDIFKPKGCPECRGNGYRGRVAIYEVVRITPGVSDLIQNNATLNEIKDQAHKEGMWSLLDSGLNKAKNGITSMEEVLAVTMGEE